MLEWTLIRGVMVAFFILANSFFVAAEFALVSIRETRVQQLITLGRPGARTVLELKRSMDDFLPAVQLGVTLAALALGWVGEPAVAAVLLRAVAHVHVTLGPHGTFYLHAGAVTVAFALITYFEVLLGELVPKSLALQRSERIALAVAAPMDVFMRITRPAVRLMNGSATVVLRFFKAPLQGEAAAHSPEELKLIATATRRLGLLPAFQEEMIHRAIELSHVTVREIMTPRGDIFALPADLAVEQASARIVEEQHSRVPVFEAGRETRRDTRRDSGRDTGPGSGPESGLGTRRNTGREPGGPTHPEHGPDHIVGVVHSKDVSRLMHFRAAAAAVPNERGGASGLTLRAVMREVLFVPETKLAGELLQEFQERRRQIAIVVDEFGSTAGLVTAEDLLEQIVGELEDEFDERLPATLLPSAGAVVLDGSIRLRDLSTRLSWAFPREPGVETLAGFVLSELGHLPVPGERVLFGGRSFQVEEMTGRRISRVRIEELARAEPARDDGAAGATPGSAARVRTAP